MIGNPPPLMERLDRAALLGAGFGVRIATMPQIIKDLAQTTGTILIISFERAAIPAQMRPGIGCAKAGLDAAKRNVSSYPTMASTSLQLSMQSETWA